MIQSERVTSHIARGRSAASSPLGTNSIHGSRRSDRISAAARLFAKPSSNVMAAAGRAERPGAEISATSSSRPSTR
jgi:hypothetical protein